ncbi:protein SGT1 homolog isoform X2 [Saccoglossus kowalevskii]
MAEVFSKANESFVDENYEEAIKLYTEAIEQDDQPDYFIKRAQAYIKLEQYSEAINDAQKAIDKEPRNSKAYLRKGIAYFYLEKYVKAKESFLEGQNLDPSDSSFKMWIRKCEAELDLEKVEETGSTTAGQPIVGIANGSVETGTSGDVSSSTPEPHSSSPTPPQPQPVSPPKIRHDWYQTEAQVVISIMIKNAKKDNVKVEYTDNTVTANVTLPSGNDYTLHLNLAHPIIAEKSITRVFATKIELKLKKADGLRWTSLEGEAGVKLKQMTKAVEASSVTKKYPSSSHHSTDWDKLARDVEEEEKNEKPEGDAALNKLFQQIYRDGNDEVRKAMNKSFMESGGTVLSTNWNEVGEKKVGVKPPDGMEWKKYDK